VPLQRGRRRDLVLGELVMRGTAAQRSEVLSFCKTRSLHNPKIGRRALARSVKRL
jgi:hypothetical protein